MGRARRRGTYEFSAGCALHAKWGRKADGGELDGLIFALASAGDGGGVEVGTGWSMVSMCCSSRGVKRCPRVEAK